MSYEPKQDEIRQMAIAAMDVLQWTHVDGNWQNIAHAARRFLVEINEALPEKPDWRLVPEKKLWCPHCGGRHVEHGVDEAGVPWSQHPHHTHLCARCGGLWRLEEYAFGVGGESPKQIKAAELLASRKAMAELLAEEKPSGELSEEDWERAMIRWLEKVADFALRSP